MPKSSLQPREIRCLTGLRGVAACYVMLYHFSFDSLSGFPRRVIQHGYMSVDLFFVLSGFVMTLTYARGFRSFPSLSGYFDFLQKRIARVYPLYLFVTAIIAALVGAHLLSGISLSAGMLTANLLLCQAWGFAATICGPAWSISTEFAAYLLFPFVVGAVVFGRSWFKWTAIGAGVALLFFVATRSGAQVHEMIEDGIVRHGRLDIYAPGTVYPLLRCFSEFLMGLAAIPLIGSRSFAGKGWGVATDILALLTFLLLLVSGTDVALALAFVPLVGLLSFEQGYTARVLRSPVIYWLGLVSYSIYLNHFFLRQVLDKPLREWIAALHLPHAAELRGLLMIAISIMAAALTYYCIEKPAREKLRSGLPWTRSIAATASTTSSSEHPPQSVSVGSRQQRKRVISPSVLTVPSRNIDNYRRGPVYKNVEVLNLPIVASSYGGLIRDSLRWARLGESKAICFATVHGVMEAYDDPRFRELYISADMLNPDGMPLVWALRLLGAPDAQRVYGPDTTELMLGAAAENNVSVGFYGGSPNTLNTLVEVVQKKWPALKIQFAESPPFRPLTEEEDTQVIQRISDAGVGFLFVGLGCPKQEEWVVQHRGRIPAVLFAVGAAFDFLAGTKPQAPRWMMLMGLEWLFRLVCEPRRLFKRYFKHNSRFLFFFGQQWLRYRRTCREVAV